jgi:hypothetical protein
MRIEIKRARAALVGFLFTVALMALGATAASATSHPTGGSSILANTVKVSTNCTSGPFANYCAAQENPRSHLGFWYGEHSEWVSIAFGGRGEFESNYKFFDWAPNGIPRNECITDSGAKLFLSPCTGATSQLFRAEMATLAFTWQNVESGLYIQENGLSKPLTAAPADGEPNQEWEFNNG